MAALSKTTTSTQTIFIEQGTYDEQVYIPSLKGGLIIYGQTEEYVPNENFQSLQLWLVLTFAKVQVHTHLTWLQLPTVFL